VKKHLFIILLCLLPTLGWAEDRLALTTAIHSAAGFGAAAPAGGPDAWYGPTVTGVANESGVALCEQITIGAGGSLTKISLYIDDKQSADIKIALYNSDGSALLSAGGTIANASLVNESFNDYTLGTPVAVNTNDVVMVCFRMSATVGYGKDDAATDAGRYASVTYAAFPAATITDEDADAHIKLRVYVD
jgi:hypothetical protein